MRLSTSPIALCCGALVVLAGCKPKESSTGAARDTAAGMASGMAADTTATRGMAASSTTTAASATPLRLADLAGRWRIRSVPDSGGKDSSVTSYVLTAKADSTGWTVTYPNRKPVPWRIVAVGGDSIVTESATFESVRRKGVRVRTQNVLRLVGDSLVGRTRADYMSKGTDTVATFRTSGTREGGRATSDTGKPKTDTNKAK